MRKFIAFALSSTLALQAVPLMAAPPLRGARAGQQAAADGTLTGTAQTPSGQTLPNHGVQARDLETGRVAATSRTDAAGGFAFTGLKAGNYVVELIDDARKVLGSSAATSVLAGSSSTVSVSATTLGATAGAAAGPGSAAGTAAAGGASGSAFSTALIVTAVAVAAGVAGVVVVARDEASPSR